MKSITKKIKSKKGSIKLFVDIEKCIITAVPCGFITPSLVKDEIEQIHNYGQKFQKPWTYCVDTAFVKFAHPLNILHLRKIKSLPNIDYYYLVTQSPLLKLLQIVLKPILKVDKVFKTMKELDQYLDIR